jgi:hypothetical protein
MSGEILAACHMHSEWSYDGSWTLDDLAAEFSRRGFSVLLMTEHDRGFTPEQLREYRTACARASSDKMLVVPGIEYSDAENVIHILTWGDVPFLGENQPTQKILDEVKSAGGVAVMAHPSRKEAWKFFDPGWTAGLLGIEVWNRKTDGWSPSAKAGPLVKATGAVEFVGMDFHARKQIFPLAMGLSVKGEVTEESVLKCLRARRCAARAFGMPLNHALLNGMFPTLGAAELGRRTAAKIYKKIKGKKPSAAKLNGGRTDTEKHVAGREI